MGNKEYVKYLAIGGTAAAVCLFVKYFEEILGAVRLAFGAAAPLFLGCAAAYVLNILLKRIEKIYFPGKTGGFAAKSRRPVCIVLSLLLLVLILALIMKLVVPELISCIRLITDEIPPLVEQIRTWAIENSSELPTFQETLKSVDVDWQSMLKKGLDLVLAGAGGIFNSLVAVAAGVVGRTAELLIALIFAIYLLAEKEVLKKQADRLLRACFKPGTRKQLLYVAATFHETFTNFITGQCMEAVIIGLLCTLGMSLLRIPYALMTGAVVGATALIPVVGAYIGAAVGAFMVFTVNPLQALLFLVFLVVLQQLEGNLIYPKVVGSSIGLPGLWVLAAVTVGGGVMGIAGMLIGVPLTASVYKLAGAAVAHRLGEKTIKG